MSLPGLLGLFESKEDVLSYLEAAGGKTELSPSKACGADGQLVTVRNYVTPKLLIRIAERPTWFGWEIEVLDPATGRRRLF
jgi:hypothetical protein